MENKETIEEVAERLYPVSPQKRKIWLDGAKWQAEKMYVEADKIMKFLDTEVELKLSDTKTIVRIKWYLETFFEQFKNK